MGKSKSGYKRRSTYQPPPGVKIEVTEATYLKLKTAARANECTIGQWAEANLRYCLKLRLNVPRPKPGQPLAVTPAKGRLFRISDESFSMIELFAEEKGKTAKQWIAATILYCLAIELERLRGVVMEPDRFK